MSFDTLLIANRGEIACRVIATARALGYRTVAVFSDADANARHTDMADEAVHIGAAPAAESYLDADKILAAAKATGAGAIHPGYGFLSENPEFARACEAAGLTFIGPSADAIEAMADKAKAKAKMLEAGVPCVPGYLPTNDAEGSDEALVAAAADVGYPLLVKAVAGGGGRGMRKVQGPDELPEAIASARREAEIGFGNGALMLERLVTGARHVEVQVFGDAHGKVIHLGERDCSLQRRHQKVIEESPSPAVDAALRARMGEAAVKAAQAIDYCGAGTVEFLLDDEGQFYFLEMNTRLQVEHPVTEMVTDLDLVALQLKVAAGEPLGLEQEDIELDGHAIEARLYAEDAYAGFMPQTGEVIAWQPSELDGVRVDHGLREGQAITAHYDPMIAKVIVWGSTRAIALRRLRAALLDTCILGPQHNKRFLMEMAAHPTFVDGQVKTDFLDALAAEGLVTPENPATLPALAAALWLESTSPHEEGGWSLGAPRRSRFRLQGGDATHDFVASREQEGHLIEVDGSAQRVRLIESSDARVRVEINGHRFEVHAALDGASTPTLHLNQAGIATSWRPLDETRGKSLDGESDGRVLSPASGKVLEVAVSVGDAVERGQLLTKMESMKIESSILAPAAGTVTQVRAAVNDQVSQGQLLVSLELPPEEG
jgi:geranyl-CoA carboxylase alpha subunit